MASTARHVALKPIEGNAEFEWRQRSEIAMVAARALTAMKQRILLRLHHAIAAGGIIDVTAKIAKANDPPEHSEWLRSFLRAIDEKDLKWSADMEQEVADLVAGIAQERADRAAGQILKGDALDAALNQASQDAVKWAREHSAQLVTNIGDATRSAVSNLTSQAIKDGWTTEQLTAELDGAWEFGSDRARMIARTEVADSATQGALIGYKAVGVTGKGWSASSFDTCDRCQALDGVEIPIEADFPDEGGDGPPLHPNCRCVIYAVVLADDASDK